MHGFAAAMISGLMILAGAVAGAQDRLVVVELFTSQGCSSCPPADALLGELATRDDVLPLALHVDYWDYIGWKDQFADPAHTLRQKEYARAAGARSIYTPQMIVGGLDHVVGYKPMKLAMFIDKHEEAPGTVTASATRSGNSARISVQAVSGNVGRSEIVLVRYLPEQRVDIRRGENAGRTITYHNIVAELAPVARWNGQGSKSVPVTLTGEGRFAVLIQRENRGPILAALRLD